MNSAPRRLLSLSRQLACPAVGTATPPLHVVRMAAAAAAPARALASACAPTPAAALSAAAAAGTTAGPSRAHPRCAQRRRRGAAAPQVCGDAKIPSACACADAPMRVVTGSDHGGMNLKASLVKWCRTHSQVTHAHRPPPVRVRAGQRGEAPGSRAQRAKLRVLRRAARRLRDKNIHVLDVGTHEARLAPAL